MCVCECERLSERSYRASVTSGEYAQEYAKHVQECVCVCEWECECVKKRERENSTTLDLWGKNVV